jgi:hypothetical protein
MVIADRSARYRERIWNTSCVDCDGKASPQPNCNLCGLPVFPGDAWQISHVGAPAALGGIDVGVAHFLCNQRHGQQVVRPMVAKAKRMRRRHIGAVSPGLTPDRLPGGRRSPLSKTFRRGVVVRQTQIEKHWATLAARRIEP